MSVKNGTYNGSKSMMTIKVVVYEDSTLDLSVKSMMMTFLNCEKVPYTLDGDVIKLDETHLQTAVDQLNSGYVVSSMMGGEKVRAAGVEFKYQPTGKDNNGTPSVWLVLVKEDGTKALSITGSL